jgi:signal transduction histidine kinase
MQISPIVKEALKLLRASLPTTIDIRQNIKTQSGMVLADPTHIHQVLMNLISNAAYAMREKGGVLEVSLTDVDINPDGAAPPHLDLKPGPYLKLTVSDTGHGIEHAIRAMVERSLSTASWGKGPHSMSFFQELRVISSQKLILLHLCLRETNVSCLLMMKQL